MEKGAIHSKISEWEHKADEDPYTRKSDPSRPRFRNHHYQKLGAHQDDVNYGCPVEGSKTEYRGLVAGVHVSNEIIELCGFIEEMGTPLPDGSVGMLFGTLFQLYTRISDKVVGMLMRARRQGFIHFEGEMLYQRRDEHVIVRLIKSPDKLIEEIQRQKEELKNHPAAGAASD